MYRTSFVLFRGIFFFWAHTTWNCHRCALLFAFCLKPFWAVSGRCQVLTDPVIMKSKDCYITLLTWSYHLIPNRQTLESEANKSVLRKEDTCGKAACSLDLLYRFALPVMCCFMLCWVLESQLRSEAKLTSLLLALLKMSLKNSQDPENK